MNKNPKILALDIASNTGWAFGEVGQVIPLSGSERICKKDASIPAKVGKAMQFIAKMIQEYDPDIIFVEKRISSSAHMANRTSATNDTLAALDHGIQGMAWNMKKDGRFRKIEEIAVASVRSHFIKAGRLKSDIAKKRVFDRCVQLGWIQLYDEDQSFDRSDALAIWSYAESQFSKVLV